MPDDNGIRPPLIAAGINLFGGPLGLIDYAGIALWLTGMVFEAGGDAQLARFKVPKQVIFGLVPKTATGKIQKFVLRERLRSASAIAA